MVRKREAQWSEYLKGDVRCSAAWCVIQTWEMALVAGENVPGGESEGREEKEVKVVRRGEVGMLAEGEGGLCEGELRELFRVWCW